MDNILVLKSPTSSLEIKDAIDERLIKARAIAGCLLTQDNSCYESNNSILHGTIWAIDDYLSEIEDLANNLMQKS
ncbi:MAG: hypothetical protein PVG30_09520 [Gammaproteobacteria bacterium]|jgi:hypothetical protein